MTKYPLVFRQVACSPPCAKLESYALRKTSLCQPSSPGCAASFAFSQPSTVLGVGQSKLYSPSLMKCLPCECTSPKITRAQLPVDPSMHN